MFRRTIALAENSRLRIEIVEAAVWFIEVASENADEVSSVFRTHGYRVFDGDAVSQRLIERGVYDWLAIPEDKIDSYARRVEAARADDHTAR
jgi:hypothetical protein